MRRRPPRELSMPFDRKVLAVVLSVQTTQELVKTIGDIRAVSRSHNARSQPSPLTQ
jgi:hypothetical protein